MIKVLVVDDHHLFAHGLKSMFQPEDGIDIVASTTNGNEVLPLLEQHDIDVVIMDISMPVIDGIDTMKLMQEAGYNTPTLMLTMHQDIRQIKRALEQNARGYILKDASKPELVEAVQKVSRGEDYFHKKVNEQLFEFLRGNKGSTDTDLVNQLSEREIEIIKQLSLGKNGNEVAEVLFISPHTVKTHRRNIMHKLGVKNTAELVKLCLEKGII